MAETKRRTVQIAELIEQVNKRNAESTCAPELRNGWNSLLESILHNARVYAGFGYYTRSDVPAGHLPGHVPCVPPEAPTAERFPDESRRFYYLHRALRSK